MGKLKEVFLHDELLQENLRSISSWEKNLREPAPIPKVKAGLTLTYKNSQKIIESNDLPYGRPMRFVEPLGVSPVSRVARNEPKTLLSKVLTKRNLKIGARYAGIFAATNIMLPGQFWANAASSAGFDVARHVASKKGITGWKSLAAGVGGSIAAHAIMGLSFSGKDDYWNSIEGLFHGGMAETQRKTLTEFGSGWDSARAMARSIYKGMDEQAAFDKFRRSDLFRSSISKALQGEGKLLGSGLTADAYAYTASIKHGIEGVSEELPFVVKKTTNERIEKQILDRAAKNMSDTSMAAINNPAREASWAAKVKEEASGWISNLQEKTIQAEERSLAKAGQYNAPSLYGTGKEYGIENAVIMEKFEGETLKGGLSLKEAKEAYSSLKKVHQAGVTHTDLWKENLFRTKEGNIGILDFGMANRLEGEGIHAKAWKGREDIIQEAAQSVLGRKTSAREFQETLDVSRLYAHYLEGQGKKTEAEKIHRFYGSFLSSSSTSGLIKESETLFRTKLAADKALGTGIKEEVVPYIKATRKPIGSSLGHAQTELFENSMERAKTNAFKAPVIQTKTSSGLGTLEEHGREAFADTILQPNRVPNEILASPVDNVASTFAAAQQYSPTMIQQDLQMRVKAPSVMASTAAERRTQIRRIKKFQSASMAATGLGFKSAKNAGRRHNSFSTLG
jgi:hypothetical protein